MITYTQGADLPDLAITWKDSDQATIDFAAGYTFQLKIGVPGNTALVTKTSGITGSTTAPNITIAWSTTGELNTLAAGIYDADLIATRIADSKQRPMRFQIRIDPAIT